MKYFKCFMSFAILIPLSLLVITVSFIQLIVGFIRWFFHLNYEMLESVLKPIQKLGDSVVEWCRK